jgi:flagellar basal-body rod modification protein FlgD
MSTGISQTTATNTTTAAQASNDKSRKTIADNFDAFLSLLTTQLRNQSPLDPLDANQFTQQLVQFSSVEQQLKTNDLLAGIGGNLGSGANSKLNAASAASLLGTRVSADASTTRLSATASGGYKASFPVTVQSNYGNYEVSIADTKGVEVFRGPWAPSGNGEQTYTWNGVSSTGVNIDPAKQYTITVTGETADGVKSRMSTERAGTVTAVDLSGSEEMVQFGDFSLPLSKVKKVSRAS